MHSCLFGTYLLCQYHVGLKVNYLACNCYGKKFSLPLHGDGVSVHVCVQFFQHYEFVGMHAEITLVTLCCSLPFTNTLDKLDFGCFQCFPADKCPACATSSSFARYILFFFLQRYCACRVDDVAPCVRDILTEKAKENADDVDLDIPLDIAMAALSSGSGTGAFMWKGVFVQLQ